MQDFSNKTIREIALEMPQTIPVFEDLRIDYCCGGRRPFAEVCQNAGIDPDMLSEKLLSAVAANECFQREKSSASELIDHIIAKHHVFTVNEIERLRGLFHKVCDRHGKQHPELFHVRDIFEDMAEEMVCHMRKEEHALFPFIKRLELATEGSSQVPPPPFGTVQAPIRMMMMEHDAAAEQFREMRDVSLDYQLPADACPSFTGLYFGLQNLEKDLHRHVHLENNVLFPQALELEEQVLAG